MATSLTVNGKNLTTLYGLAVAGIPQWRTVPLRTLTRIPVEGVGGAMFAPPTVGAPRELQIQGTMRQETAALAVSNEDTVKSLLTAGLVTITVNDGGGFIRQVQGYTERIEVTPVGLSMVPLATKWEITVACPSPSWRDPEPILRGLPTVATRYTLPLGTAPSAPTLRIAGAVTNPVLIYRDVGGAVVKTLTITLALASTDYLHIDMRKVEVTKYVSGTASDALGVVSGDFPWILDPQDGDWPTSAWPTLEVTGAGASAEALYWKQWL